jgi:hypothetical protein
MSGCKTAGFSGNSAEKYVCEKTHAVDIVPLKFCFADTITDKQTLLELTAR